MYGSVHDKNEELNKLMSLHNFFDFFLTFYLLLHPYNVYKLSDCTYLKHHGFGFDNFLLTTRLTTSLGVTGIFTITENRNYKLEISLF